MGPVHGCTNIVKSYILNYWALYRTFYFSVISSFAYSIDMYIIWYISWEEITLDLQTPAIYWATGAYVDIGICRGCKSTGSPPLSFYTSILI